MEFNFLVQIGVIRDEDAHQKRIIKANTNLVYKQQKYNLLREEVEGFSKIVVLLENLPDVVQDPESIIAEVFSIIGHFDLDPNRVLDIILDVFEEQISNSFFVALLKQFKVANIVHILGNKFVSYHVKDNDNTVCKFTPRSLYLLAAVLVAVGLVDLVELLAYLLPNISDTVQAIRTFSKTFKSDLSSAQKEQSVVLTHCMSAVYSHASGKKSALARAPVAPEQSASSGSSNGGAGNIGVRSSSATNQASEGSTSVTNTKSSSNSNDNTEKPTEKVGNSSSSRHRFLLALIICLYIYTYLTTNIDIGRCSSGTLHCR
jgi:hypothetical protein